MCIDTAAVMLMCAPRTKMTPLCISIISAALLSNTHAQLNSTSQNSSGADASTVTSPQNLVTRTYESAIRTDYQPTVTQGSFKRVTVVTEVEEAKGSEPSTTGAEIYSVTSDVPVTESSQEESRPTIGTPTRSPVTPSPTELVNALTHKSTEPRDVTSPEHTVNTGEISLNIPTSTGDDNVTDESVVETSEALEGVTTESSSTYDSPTSIRNSTSSFTELPVTTHRPTVGLASTGVPTTDASGEPTTDIGVKGQSESSSLTRAWETRAPEQNSTSLPETPSIGQMPITQTSSLGVPGVTSEVGTTESSTMNVTTADVDGDSVLVTGVAETTTNERHVDSRDVTTDLAAVAKVTARDTNNTVTAHPVTPPTSVLTTDYQPSHPSDRNVTISPATTAPSNGTAVIVTSGDLPPGSSNILPIAIGASAGALLIVLIIILVCVCRKKRKEIERKNRYLREEENVMDYVYHPRRPSNSIPPYKVNGSGLRMSNTGPQENLAADDIEVDPATKPAIRNYFQEGLRGLEQNGDRTPPEYPEHRPHYDSSNVIRREKKPSFPMRAISAKSRASMGPILLTEDSDGQPSTQKTYDKMYSSHSTFRK